MGIIVTAVNEAPVNTVPGLQTTNEDTAKAIFGLSISDPDAGTNPVQVTLTVASGTLTLSSTAGLTFNAGANGTSSMTVTGTLANINAALNGLSFLPNLNFSGAATLTITTNDLGNTGSGGPLADTDTVAISITAVNDAPVNTVPRHSSRRRRTSPRSSAPAAATRSRSAMSRPPRPRSRLSVGQRHAHA